MYPTHIHYDFTTIKSGPTVGLGPTLTNPGQFNIQPCNQEEEKKCIRKVVILKDNTT